LVAVTLFTPILLDGLRVTVAILTPIVGMLRPPFPRTVQADLAIFRIGLDFVAVVFRTAPALALQLAAYSLLRPVGGGLERLFAIAAAAGNRQSELLCLSFSKSLAGPKNLESSLEFLLPPPMGLKLMEFSAARLMYFYIGTDTLESTKNDAIPIDQKHKDARRHLRSGNICS
jgi:hypothetical protein